jgi:hypothetical protein
VLESSYKTKTEVMISHACSYGEYRILAGKPLGKLSLGKKDKGAERPILERSM